MRGVHVSLLAIVDLRYWHRLAIHFPSYPIIYNQIQHVLLKESVVKQATAALSSQPWAGCMCLCLPIVVLPAQLPHQCSTFTSSALRGVDEGGALSTSL